MSRTSPASTVEPVLITDAPVSYPEQFARRRRRYATIIALRIPCLVLAGIFYQTWWLALAFLALSLPLPWVAVLIANDSPPRRRKDPHLLRGAGSARRLGVPDRPVLGPVAGRRAPRAA